MDLETIFAGDSLDHQTAHSVFLAGPTAGDVEMLGGWRRYLINQLKQRSAELDTDFQLVIPEPRNGIWSSVMSEEYGEEEQTLWEHQAMKKASVVVFWLPTFWNAEHAGPYPANIGPSSRFEFGFMLANILNNPAQKLFVGSPERAQALQWAKTLCQHYGIEWHYPSSEKPQELLPQTLVDDLIDYFYKQ